MASPLKPEVSVTTGLAVAALVYTIYGRSVPPGVDQRMSEPGDEDAEAARKQALWTSVAVCAGISLLVRDSTVFIIGGAMTVALDWGTRANIWTNPITRSAQGLLPEDQMHPTQDMDPDAYGPSDLTAVG